MSHKAPFTVHFKITPVRGTRFETIRSLQRFARAVYDALVAQTGITVAAPGGGQSSSLDASSDLANGCAVKPQIGSNPAQLMITGFYNTPTGTKNVQTYPDKTVDFNNDTFTGAGGAWPSGSIPVAQITTEVKALVAILKAAVAATAPVVSASIFRLEYKGIIFGDRGYHLPQ